MEVNEVHGFLEYGMYDYYGKSKKAQLQQKKQKKLHNGLIR